MAKVSAFKKNIKRKKLVNSFANKRAGLKSIIKNKATINFENAGKKVINLENIDLRKIKDEHK